MRHRRSPFTSKRWTILIFALAILLVLALLGVSDAVLGPYATGVAGAVAVFMGGESWAEKERARLTQPPAEIEPELQSALVQWGSDVDLVKAELGEVRGELAAVEHRNQEHRDRLTRALRKLLDRTGPTPAPETTS